MKETSSEIWEHFREFVTGFAAAQELYSRAGSQGAFIECVCLEASLTDAMLRLGIVLQYQLDNQTREIPRELIFQDKSDKAISEREIYRRAHSALVIDYTTFDRLQTLYDKRNCVIHRYIISRITTEEVLNIAISYEEIINILSDKIYSLEEEQIQLGVGITVRGPTLKGKEGKRFIEKIADKKHSPRLAKLIRRNT